MDKLSALLRLPPKEMKSLSNKTGIAIQRLEDLSAGAKPKMPELRAISVALNISMRSMSDTDSEARPAEMLFRSAFAAGDGVPDEVRMKLSSRVSDPISMLARRVSSQPSWRSRFVAGRANTEANASAFRELFCNNDQLSPLIRLPQIAERELGILILVIKSNSVDGASGYLNGVPFALVSARSFTPRMLFTLAHEVGHILLHHDPANPSAIIDENIDRYNGNEQEREANDFASALLLPAQAVGIALKTVRSVLGVKDDELGDLEISFLANVFGVSVATAALRCEKLGLLPNGGAAALMYAVEDEFSSPEARAKLAGLPPRSEIKFPKVPLALLEATVEQIRAGDVSLGRAASSLQISIAELMAANVGGHA